VPYRNVPEELWTRWTAASIKVMAKGQDKEAAIAICHAQIVGGKSMEDAMHQFILERAEIKLISFGSEVKALGDGRVGGYLVQFGDEDTTDLTGDYFTKETDFGELTQAPILYQHGLDKKMGKRKLGKGDLKEDELGVWIRSPAQPAG